MILLFRCLAGAVATSQTAGAFLCGLRLMALDGMTLDNRARPVHGERHRHLGWRMIYTDQALPPHHSPTAQVG